MKPASNGLDSTTPTHSAELNFTEGVVFDDRIRYSSESSAGVSLARYTCTSLDDSAMLRSAMVT